MGRTSRYQSGTTTGQGPRSDRPLGRRSSTVAPDLIAGRLAKLEYANEKAEIELRALTPVRAN
jgi:hypothetical protein